MAKSNPKLMPPSEETISSEELWAQITRMPRPHRLVPFPRNDESGRPMGEICMQVLTQEESMLATASAERWVRKILKEHAAMPSTGEPRSGYEGLMEMRQSLELLYRSCRKVEDITKPFFPAIETIGQKLSTSEVGVLVFSYNRVSSELGPLTSQMGEEEMEAWIEVLAKGGGFFPFDSLSLGAQTALITYMAKLCVSSRTASSSPGSLPEEPVTAP